MSSPDARDAFAVVDVELGLAEGRGHLVLDDLDLGARADDDVAVLERRDAADVDADRRVELERAAAGRRLGVAEEHADLLADLVDEDQAGARLRDDRGQLAQGLGHQTGLEAHLRLAHLALDLGLRHEGRHRVDDDDVDRSGADQHLGDLEGLLAVVRLRHQEVVGVDAELLGVVGVERVLGVDEGREASGLLRLGDDLEGKRRLAGGLRAEDLDDAAARDPADAERGVDRERARRDDGDGRFGPLAEPHDRTLAELTLDLSQRRLDGAPLLVGFDAGHVLTFLNRGKNSARSARL